MGKSKTTAKKTRFWELDPSMYESQSKPKSFWTRLLGRLKASVGFVALTILFAYPLVLVYLGLVYGWLGFWGSFLGSVLVIGIIIKRTGYAKHFENAGSGSFFTGILGISLGFVIAVSMYEGLFILKSWIFPVVVLLLLAGLGYKIKKG